MQIKSFLIAVAATMAYTTTHAQDVMSALGGDSASHPIFILDSVKSDLKGLNPANIAFISVVKSKHMDDSGADEWIYIETKPFARRRYTRMLSALSPEYGAAVTKSQTDSSFQYILDGSALTSNVESMLAALEKDKIASVTMLSADQLKKQYNINDKKTGVLITTK
jgi:hypothetical protein